MNSEPTIQQLFDLTGRTAIVTGGTGRLGLAIAQALAESGASVVVTSRDGDRAAAAAYRLHGPENSRHCGLELNHLEPGSIEEFVRNVVDRYGRIDVLVNNAHQHLESDLTRCSADEFNRQLANATGYFELGRHVRNRAVERNAPASIIMLGSMYGAVASYPEVYENISSASPVAYHALKGGVLQMTRHLAVYWAKDRVRVNAISPGPFPSADAPEALLGRLSEKSPMGRIGQPFELKGACLFLASDASSYVTGHNLFVDGGWTAW